VQEWFKDLSMHAANRYSSCKLFFSNFQSAFNKFVSKYSLGCRNSSGGIAARLRVGLLRNRGSIVVNGKRIFSS
jgi:hypothetical protein